METSRSTAPKTFEELEAESVPMTALRSGGAGELMVESSAVGGASQSRRLILGQGRTNHLEGRPESAKRIPRHSGFTQRVATQMHRPVLSEHARGVGAPSRTNPEPAQRIIAQTRRPGLTQGVSAQRRSESGQKVSSMDPLPSQRLPSRTHPESAT